MRKLKVATDRCRISTLELPRCDVKGQDAESLGGMLAHCPALTLLDLCGNSNFGAVGAERIAGVLGQCRELVNLNLSKNLIGPAGTEVLAGVLAQFPTLTHLNLSEKFIGAERLPGVLGQCTALTHLDLSHNNIEAAGAESLAGAWYTSVSDAITLTL
jgi:Ran GTPase-activating protein (RanGAP) involved in mRNA processing and transport